jgi:iron-sulfur cluster repair protein YtfE (RIC family)
LIPVKAIRITRPQNSCSLIGHTILREFHSMTTISNYLGADHKHCDTLFAAAEEVVANGDWDKAAESFRSFYNALLHHFSMEEEIMFPAFESRTGMTQGPTSVMRSEHSQMTSLLNRMHDATARKDMNAYLGDADTLLILMQQHNVKEEQMLYRMADQALVNELDEVVARMRAVA